METRVLRGTTAGIGAFLLAWWGGRGIPGGEGLVESLLWLLLAVPAWVLVAGVRDRGWWGVIDLFWVGLPYAGAASLLEGAAREALRIPYLLPILLGGAAGGIGVFAGLFVDRAASAAREGQEAERELNRVQWALWKGEPDLDEERILKAFEAFSRTRTGRGEALAVELLRGAAPICHHRPELEPTLLRSALEPLGADRWKDGRIADWARERVLPTLGTRSDTERSGRRWIEETLSSRRSG